MRLSIYSRPGRSSFLGALLLSLGSACASGTVDNPTGGSGGTSGSAGAGGRGNAGTGGSQSAGAGGSRSGGAGGGGPGGVGATGGHAGTSGGGGSAVGGTAGTAGAGGGLDGGSGGATFGCAGKTYKLCEDFETGTVGGIPTGWTALNGYGSDSAKGVGLATGEHHSGSMALQSTSMVPGEERVQKSLAALGATATKHWGRIFYKVQSPAPLPASGAVIHVTLGALEGTTENRVVDTVEASSGKHQWLFNIPDDSCCSGTPYNWSFDTDWHCAEWYVDVATESYRFFTDNTEVMSLAFTENASAKMSSYKSFALGAIFYQTPPSPFVIWFDDLAIDDAQIHCQ
jgi:hypothetical protein